MEEKEKEKEKEKKEMKKDNPYKLNMVMALILYHLLATLPGDN